MGRRRQLVRERVDQHTGGIANAARKNTTCPTGSALARSDRNAIADGQISCRRGRQSGAQKPLEEVRPQIKPFT